MNYYLISAGVFLFIALLVHMIFGDKDYRELNPRKRDDPSEKMFGCWLMGRGTFQMVSVDLLLTSVVVFLTGVNCIPFNLHLMLFIALLYAGYFVFWLSTLLVSKAGRSNYLTAGQWMIFLVAFVLIGLGIYHGL